MFIDQDSTGNRLRAVLPVAAIHAGLAFVLLRGLAAGAAPEAAETLKLIRLPPPEQVQPELQPPPPPPPADGRAQKLRQADPRPEGAASPPNLMAEPTPVAAPEQVVKTPTPQPLPAAEKPGTGAAQFAGAAEVRGPGTGSGGVGTGRGSGLGGGGLGGGGGGGGGGYGSGMPVGRLSPPRQVAGRLSMADLPEELRESGFRGRVWVNYRVEADGSVTNCRVTRSSGNRGVDQMTCRLVERRFRYRPARDEVGRPFWGNIEEFHDWESETFMEPPPNRRRRMDW